MKSPPQVWPARLMVLIALLLTLVFGTASAQASLQDADGGGQPEEKVSDVPEDAFGRGTPRGAISGFLEAAEANDFARASEYLDLRGLPRRLQATGGVTLAEQLNLVFERELWIDVAQLSGDAEGRQGDSLAPFRDEIGRISLDDREVVLYVDRVLRDDGQLIWKISRLTVAHAPELYEQFGYSPWVESIAKALPEGAFLGVELFKWVIAIGSMLIAYVVIVLICWIVMRATVRRDSPMYGRLRRLCAGPLAILMVSTFGGLVLIDLGMGATGQRIARAHTLTIVLSVWLLFSFISLITEVIANRLRAKGRDAATVLLRPILNSLKIVVVLGAFLLWLDNIGVNITTLLAGLGVGGLAVALALQKPLEDLFGAITLFSQQSIRVNDFCRFGSKLGTVEEIGLRTTRVRTLENTVLSLPNSKFAAEYIENISARRKIRYHTLIRLRHDTNPEQMRAVLEKTRSLLTSHRMIETGTNRVRFTALDTHAHIVEAHAYVLTTDYATFLEVAEEINLGVVDIVSSAGAQFAAPVWEESG